MSTGKLTAAEARHSERHDPLDSGEDHRWHDLVSQLGVEIAEPLTAALERIHGLTGDRQDRPREPARAARRGRARAPGRHDRPAADALRVGQGQAVA
jgi:hypothetical protein